jgi:membrane-associated phospholipid phosphatase
VKRLRTSELIALGYFGYAALLALMRPIGPGLRWRILGANLAVLAVLAGLARLKQSELVRVLRLWLAPAFILLAYKEMGWLALPHAGTALEDAWIQWDRWLFYQAGFKAAVESLGPVLPALLELAYLLVYLVAPLTVGLALGEGEHEAERVACLLLLATLCTYALYPLFPSEPPRSVFPGADLPVETSLLRRVNLLLVSNYGIHTSVFPSGHTTAAFAAAFGLWRYLPRRPWAGRALLVLAVLIGLATVYGRYHYAVDSLAGVAVAVLAWLAWLAVRWQDARAG